MNKIREVTVFSKGDSRELDVWSNIPYFFTETLIKKGIKVNRVDIDPNPMLRKLLNATFFRLFKLLNKKTTYNYNRSKVCFILTRKKIRREIARHPNAQCNIFLTFSFSSAGLTQKPCILFGDWTYAYSFETYLERKPDFFEKKSIKRENRQIDSANLLFPLFPRMAEAMKIRHPNKEIYYLGNVVNSMYEASESDLETKEKSGELLFVGSSFYIDGAKILIEAFQKLKQSHPHLKLHIVGMDESLFEFLPPGVHCYGYLDKGKREERELYYKLFRESKILINTTPKWGAFSSTIEAMYFYTPVIVSPYGEFVETFGTSLNFGSYCEKNDADLLVQKIEPILNDIHYKTLCINAHLSVESYTWNAYIGKLLEKIEAKFLVS